MKRHLYILCLAVAITGCGGYGGSSKSGTKGTGGGTTSFAVISSIGTGIEQNQIGDNGLMVGEEGLTLQDGSSAQFAVTQTVGGQPNPLPPGQQGAQKEDDTVAACVNGNGLIGGFEQNVTSRFGTIPVVWLNDTLTPLNFPVSDTGSFVISALNNKGQIVGFSSPTDGVSTVDQSYYWPNSSAKAVPLAPAGLQLLAVNDSGIAVGAIPGTSSAEYFKIDLNQTTAATDLHLSVPVSSNQNVPPRVIVINDAGTIALTSGAAHDLIEIDSSGRQSQLAVGAIPVAINSQGDIVGQTDQGRAFVYTPSKGLLDMNKYVDPNSGIVLQGTLWINARGQVLAFGTAGGQQKELLVQLPSGAF